MNSPRAVIVGGGAAGIFAAIACAERSSGAEVIVLEKSAHFLSKVKISGGGRCNVTHACFDEREFAARYPRGGQALIGPFKQFQAADTVAWFAERGVKLKTESDGRMFPVTDSSQTIMDCLLDSAHKAGVKLQANCGVERIVKRADERFELTMAGPNPPILCDKVLLAIGGCRTPALGQMAVSLGHTLEPPVPSLFTFQIETPWLRQLAGVAVEAEAFVVGTKLRERGAVLVTHWGLSGPAILRLSAWGARLLNEMGYRFTLRVNWLPDWNTEKLLAEFQTRRVSHGARLLVNSPIASMPARLWVQLVQSSGVMLEARWASLSRSDQQKLVRQLTGTEFQVGGKSLNKDEFVTCGGVRLSEVNFKTMESRVCRGLFFAGEVLDIDGITGGFNFQSAWTTGWIAGRAIAGE